MSEAGGGGGCGCDLNREKAADKTPRGCSGIDGVGGVECRLRRKSTSKKQYA